MYQGLDASGFWAHCDSICGHYVCTLETRVFNRFSSYSQQICVEQRSGCQKILSTCCFICGLQGAKYVCFLHALLTQEFSTDLFQITFFRPRPRCKLILGALQLHFWPPGGQVFFSYMCPITLRFQLIFSKFAPNIHWTKIYTLSHFHHPLVTFVATRGPTSIFTVYRADFATDFKFTANIYWAMV